MNPFLQLGCIKKFIIHERCHLETKHNTLKVKDLGHKKRKDI